MTVSPRALALLPALLLGLAARCATLPKVSDVIEKSPASSDTLRIASAGGFLSPGQSRALLDRLKRDTTSCRSSGAPPAR